jgi:ankyrin repeat protein
MMKSLAMTPANREKLAQELHMACENRDMSKATLLLTKGVSPNQKTPFGRLPLFTAIEAGQYNMVKLLLDHGSKVNQERKIYNSNLSDRIYLANGGWLLPRETPLSTAIGTRNVGIVKLLIQYGADVATKESTQLPLLFKSIASNEAAILKILLDNGGDSEVNYKGTVKDGTPLMTAIKADNVEMVRYLLDYGADPNGVQQRVGFTPLCYAIHLNGNVHGIVSLLVGRGVNVDERCELYGHFGTFSWLTQRRDHVGYLTHIGGLTAVYLAARRDTHLPTLKLLLSHGANPNTRLTYRDDYSNPNKVRTVPGPTPLQDAANGEVVKLLVQHGASLSVMDHHSRAP